jgi:hypothetical protein
MGSRVEELQYKVDQQNVTLRSVQRNYENVTQLLENTRNDLDQVNN